MTAAAVAMRQPWRLLLVALLVSLPILVLNFATAHFGYSDDDVFMQFYARGEPYPMPIWADDGRFFPLGHQEWRLIYRFAKSATAYYAFASVQYVLFNWLLAVYLRLNDAFSFLALVLVNSFGAVLISFSVLVVPERNLLLLFAALAVVATLQDRHRTPIRLLAMLLVANLMLYLKETAFVFVATFAAVRLLHAFASHRRLGTAILGAALADILLLVSAAAWLVLYATVSNVGVLATGAGYRGVQLAASDPFATLGGYLRHEPGTIATIALSLALLPLLRRRPVALASALAAAAYFAAFLVLGLDSAYYSSLPAAAAATALVVAATLLPGRAVRAAVFAVLIAANLAEAAPVLAYRTDWILRNQRIVDELRRRGAGRVAITGDPWDVQMVNDKIELEAPQIEVVDPARHPRFVVDLGRDLNRRDAYLADGGVAMPIYASQWFEAIGRYVPEPLRWWYGINYGGD